VPVLNTLSQAVHTAPGTALTVKLCKDNTDRELITLCAPNGDKIVLQYDVTTVPPTLSSAWNLTTNTAYAGATSTLTDCGAEKVDVSAGEDYCLSGVNYTRIDIIDVKTLLPAGTLWLNDAGSPVVAPVGATKGICQAVALPVYDIEQIVEVGCANNATASRITTTVFDTSTGAIVGVPTVTAPVGFVLGECGCPPVTAKGVTGWGF
jgi:hypothetical protein